MKRLGKVLCLLLSFVMVFGLTACGDKKPGSTNKQTESSKDYVYTMEELPVQLEDADISNVYVVGDKIYAFGQKYDFGDESMQPRVEEAMLSSGSTTATAVEGADVEATETATEEATETATEEATEAKETTEVTEEGMEPGMEPGEEAVGTMDIVISVFNMDGTQVSTFKKTFGSDSGSNGIVVGDNGTIYMVLSEYGKDMTNPEFPKDLFTLYALDSQGNEQWNVELGKDIKQDEYYYVNQIIADKAGNIIILSSKGVEVYGPDSTKIIELPLEETDGASNLVMLNGEKCALICYGEESMYLKTVDFETKKLSEQQTFPFNAYSYSLFSGRGYDLFLTDSNGLYGFNLGDAAVIQIMDYVDSDIMVSNIFGICLIDDTSFIGTYYSEETGVTSCAKFTKVDPSTIKDKEILTLGCMYLDSDVRKQVVEYNKNNSEYRIKVMDYSSYNTDSDYTIASTKLNTDIVTGNMPDILLLSNDMPISSYNAKGLFADLNPFFESDPELKKEDYLPNVMDALSENDKLYQIVPGFYIFTVFGKSADVGTGSGWTFDELKQLVAEKGPEVQAFSDITRQDFMNYSMWFCNEQYINWQTGECNFTSQDFIDNLEFASQYPAEISYENYDDEYWNDYQTSFRDGRTLLMISSLSTFSDYSTAEQGTFGEAITPIGFPASDKNGNAMNFNLNFAISSKSKNQQEAWNFIRYFLTDEYQDKMEYCLPVKISRLEELAKAAQSKPFYTDENGEKVEYDNTYYLNGEEVIIPPMTQEQTDKVMNFIKSVNHVMDYNTSINDIINEESEAFFTDQKTAQEVADIIQSRVQIYVNENR